MNAFSKLFIDFCVSLNVDFATVNRYLRSAFTGIDVTDIRYGDTDVDFPSNHFSILSNKACPSGFSSKPARCAGRAIVTSINYYYS
jgi:hypothetical protein